MQVKSIVQFLAKVFAVLVAIVGLLLYKFNKPASSYPLVAVMGGTGLQGGGVIDVLLSQRRFRVRTMTRNIASKEALKLKERGVEVIQGSTQSKLDLLRLFQGATYAFTLTFSDFEMGREMESGVNLAKAIAKSYSVTHVVFSGGKRTGIDVLDTKANIEQEMRRIWATSKHAKRHLKWVLFLHSSFFYENLLFKSGTKRVIRSQSDPNSIQFVAPLPNGLSVPMVSSSDIGRAAAFAICTHELNFIDFELKNDTTTSVRSEADDGSVIERIVEEEQGGQGLSVGAIQLVGEVASGERFAQVFNELAESGNYTERATYQSTGSDRESLKKTLPPKEAAAIELMYQWFEKMADQAKESGEQDRLTTSKRFPIVRDVYLSRDHA